MKKLAIVLSILATVSPSLYAEDPNVREGVGGTMETFQEWTVIPLTVTSEDIRIRSAQINATDQSVLILDLHVPECTTYTVNVNVNATGHSIQSGVSQQLPAKIKIDGNFPHAVEYFLEAQEGIDTLVLNLVEFKEPTIMTEMQFGTTVVLEFTLPQGSPIYTGFPLAGFEQATNRAKELCKGFNSYLNTTPNGQMM